MVTRKYEVIPVNEVPDLERRAREKWNEIFESIPKDMAIIIPKEEAHNTTIRAALSARQKRGEFKNLKIVSRKVGGVTKTYVLNP